MNKQEFTEEAKKRGLRDEYISMAIQLYDKLHKDLPSFLLDEKLIEESLKSQIKMDNDTDDFITVD